MMLIGMQEILDTMYLGGLLLQILPFGGYGPSFTNPRTGEIIGADIMLEWAYLTNRVNYESSIFPIDEKVVIFAPQEVTLQEGNLLAGILYLWTLKELFFRPKSCQAEHNTLSLCTRLGHTLGLES